MKKTVILALICAALTGSAGFVTHAAAGTGDAAAWRGGYDDPCGEDYGWWGSRASGVCGG